jgi:hypothetical protein
MRGIFVFFYERDRISRLAARLQWLSSLPQDGQNRLFGTSTNSSSLHCFWYRELHFLHVARIHVNVLGADVEDGPRFTKEFDGLCWVDPLSHWMAQKVCADWRTNDFTQAEQRYGLYTMIPNAFRTQASQPVLVRELRLLF